MKTKALIISLILYMTAATRVHSFGLGAQFNFSTGAVAPGAALLISPLDNVHLAVNWYLDFDKVNTIGLTLDLTFLVLPITNYSVGTLNFTLGGGVFAIIIFTDDRGFDGGLRLPIGFNFVVDSPSAGKVEVFSHIAPSFGIHFLPSMKLSDPFFPAALGVRFWLS